MNTSLQAMETLFAVWLVALGGTIGSFLNVVVYRLPLGMSLSQPGSHCPRCKKPIRWHDNLPVLGWFVLRGRCRDCHLPISLRYPLVEGVTASMFLLLAFAEFFSRAGNLPYPTAFFADRPGLPILSWPETAGVYAYHLWLLCTLLAATLIAYDGKPVPHRLGLPAAIVGVVAGVLWPHLHPARLLPSLDRWGHGLDGVIAGAAAGILIGVLCDLRRVGRAQRVPPYSGPRAAAILVGIFLGWQAALVLGLPILLITLAGPLFWPGRPHRTEFVASLLWLLGSLAWIVAWERVVGQFPCLG